MKALRKLNAMVGKEFIYKQKNIIIKDIDLTDDGITVETNDKPISLKGNDVGAFCEACLPVDNKTALVVMTKEESGTLSELKEILMSNIKKCQADAAYVKQATVINNNVNTLINMVSLELKVRKHTI